MATIPTAPRVENFSSNKGVISPCRACKSSDPKLPPPLRVSCKFCLGNGFVAKCLPCDGKGMVIGVAAWDGKSKHGSVCNACGGSGMIPARRTEWEAQEAAGKK